MILNKITNYNSSSGFTLIEILVAATISSIMMLMMYTAYRTTIHTVRDLTGYAEFYENVNLAMFKIDRDLTNLYVNRENTDVAFVADISGGSSEVTFITANSLTFSFIGDMQTPYPLSDIREVGYKLIPDERFSGIHLLVRREKIHYDEEIGTGGTENLLLENVISMNFEFRVGNEWTSRWDSREHRRYPEAVKVTFKVKDYTGTEEEFSFISVMSMM